MNPAAQIIVAFLFGVSFLVTLVVLAIKFPNPAPFQYNVFRVVLSLAAAGAGAMIPGFLDVNLNPSAAFALRAGGALAVFVIVYFWNPAHLVSGSDRPNGTPPPAAMPASKQESMLLGILDKLDSELQDALALAALQARRENEQIVATHHVFAAFLRLQPGKLPSLVSQIKQISTEALPHPLDGVTSPDRAVLREPLTFSACVRDSLTNLAPAVADDRKLSSEDVFVDIARHGHGQSVRRLRTHGISQETINSLVDQLGWQVIERRAAPDDSTGHAGAAG